MSTRQKTLHNPFGIVARNPRSCIHSILSRNQKRKLVLRITGSGDAHVEGSGTEDEVVALGEEAVAAGAEGALVAIQVL